MVQRVFLFTLLGLATLSSAARINSKSVRKSNATEDSTGADICSISEKTSSDVHYNIKFEFKTEGKCNRASCNAFKFLDDTVEQMMDAKPDHGGQADTCSCYVKEGPTSNAADHHFLMTFLRFKKKSGRYEFQCTPKECWERYSMLVTLAKKAERGSMDWPRTDDIESRNHWDSKCLDSTAGGGHITPTMELPSAHQVIQELKEKGKTDGIEEIMEIVNDKEQISVEELEEMKAKAEANQKKQVFIADLDDGNEKTKHMVGFNDVHTELREVVILSSAHGKCSQNALKFSRFDGEDVICKIIENPADCEMGKKLLGGRSDVFNDMSAPTDNDQAFATPFAIRTQKMYPPGCFGRLPSADAPMHVSYNPLLPAAGNRERGAKANKGANVRNKIICGCYDKA